MKLSGIDIDLDTEETDIDGEEDFNRKPMGAINPLLMGGIDHGGSAREFKLNRAITALYSMQ